MANIGLLAGIGAGIAQGMRQSKQDAMLEEHLREMRELRRQGAGAPRPVAPQPGLNSLNPGDYLSSDENGNVVPMLAVGGLVFEVGHRNDVCDFVSSSWQKQSFKK